MQEFENTRIWDDFLNNKDLTISHLKNYEFLEKIGQGGMGAVYKARQLHPQRIVAIKISKAVSTSSIRRFEREMQIASQLDHPGIAKIYDAGVQNNQKYLVMDYIEGQSLDKYFETASLQQKLNIMIEVCSIIDYAHRQKIIHRDLKPANIMITSNGKPVVIDFGLAKDMQTRNFDLTKTGEVIGTPNYMAPEQIVGKSSNIDRRVDIYAIGAILYEIICGKRMVTSTNSLEALFQIQQADFIPPHKINPQADKSLVNIWRKATAIKKHRRYECAKSIGDDLRKFAEGGKVKAPTNNNIYAVGIFLVAISIITLMFYQSYRSQLESIELSQAQKEQQKKQQKKFQQIILNIENKNIPENFDTKDLNNQQLLEIAKTLYNERLYKKAFQLLDTLPNQSITAKYYKGLILYQQQQYANAQKSFEALLKEEQKAQYHYYLGMSAFKQNAFHKSLHHLQIAEKSFSNDIPILETIAEILQAQQNILGAKTYLKRCISLSPYTGKYAVRLGKLELHDKNYYRAFSYLKKAINTSDFFEALALMHDIPYNEPLLRRWCYQSLMHKCISEKEMKSPDLCSDKWEEIENRYRQDYIAQHHAKKNSKGDLQPFLKKINNDEIKKTVRDALITLRYNPEFDAKINGLLKDTSLPESTVTFFKELQQEVHAMKAKEQRAIYYKLAHMQRNNNWHSKKFPDINAKNCLKMLHMEKKVLLRYLLIQGCFHMFGFQPIVEIAKNNNENLVTRMLCVIVLRKNYLAENIDVFYSLPTCKEKLAVEEQEFLQISICQALYTPHFLYRLDTFHRPMPYRNKMEEKEKQLLLHLLRNSKSTHVSTTAALSLHALLPKNTETFAEINKIIFRAMQSDNEILASYTHSLFWMSPNAERAEYFEKYKQALQSDNRIIQEIVLSQIEIFRHRIRELIPEIKKCLLQTQSQRLRFRALFAWALHKRKKTIFEDTLYKSVAKNLTPLEQSSRLLFEFYKFFFDTRRLKDLNQTQVLTRALAFLNQLKIQLHSLPPTSQCMVSYVMSLLQLHPSLQKLRNIKDPQLLAYFLYQLHQQVDIGSNKEFLLPYIGAISPKQKYYIAKQFLSHKDPRVRMYASSSYTAFTSDKERNKIFRKAKASQDQSLKKGVALGHYFSLQNAWINDKKAKSITFDDLFSNRSLDLILADGLLRLRKFVEQKASESPEEFEKYRKWIRHAVVLCPEKSEYIYAQHLFFPPQKAIYNVARAIEYNQKHYAGNFKYMYILRLLKLLSKNNRNQQVEKYFPSVHEIPASLLVYFSRIYEDQKKYNNALRLYEKYFLSKTKDTSPFSDIISYHSEMMNCYIKNDHRKTAKIFLEYFYQLDRRMRAKKNTEPAKDDFLKKLQKSKPHIDIVW
ncbi:serine/threonine-protein kinase [Candidatus Uabimicrobium amorphum]|uniref:non-specific serine/threonine protein kinase n=1 Tax=Uabimicrobium amorphum TaxID=2596890 RepID=A0A5S9IPL6_UABAM|nr:serine/threonine-protein kinase [Candidatus Uabimicrobium amorphum]BBM84355.1 protein kinase [Candidatus Uabimicrobium amorphum]